MIYSWPRAKEEVSHCNMRFSLSLERNPQLFVKNNLYLMSYYCWFPGQKIKAFYRWLFASGVIWIFHLQSPIFNGLLPLSSISLLGDYTFGNSKQEILVPHSWEVILTGLLIYAVPVDQKCKDLVKLLSWRCKKKMLDRLEDIGAWPGSFSNTHKQFHLRKKMPRALETGSKHNCSLNF